MLTLKLFKNNIPLRHVVLCIGIFASLLNRSVAEPLDYPSPFPAFNSVFLDQLTWIEVRDFLKRPLTRIIVATGGIEQNGPYVALNKHDLIVREVSALAAKKLGDTLVAPIISYVPEGMVSPPEGHMQYAGTISLRDSTFISLLEDTIRSLAAHGFRQIVVIGDSGQSQEGMRKGVENVRHDIDIRAELRFIPEFYNYDKVREMISAKGYKEKPEGFHDELAFTLQVLAIDPNNIRYDQRAAANKLSLNGVSLADKVGMIQLGREILEYRAQRLVELIRGGR